MVACDLTAKNACIYVVKLGAVGDHSRLGGQWSLNTIARGSSRGGGDDCS